MGLSKNEFACGPLCRATDETFNIITFYAILDSVGNQLYLVFAGLEKGSYVNLPFRQHERIQRGSIDEHCGDDGRIPCFTCGLTCST